MKNTLNKKMIPNVLNFYILKNIIYEPLQVATTSNHEQPRATTSHH